MGSQFRRPRSPKAGCWRLVKLPGYFMVKPWDEQLSSLMSLLWSQVTGWNLRNLEPNKPFHPLNVGVRYLDLAKGKWQIYPSNPNSLSKTPTSVIWQLCLQHVNLGRKHTNHGTPCELNVIFRHYLVIVWSSYYPWDKPWSCGAGEGSLGKEPEFQIRLWREC